MSGEAIDEITIDVIFPHGLAPAPDPLEQSIAHWRRMRDAETVEELHGECPSSGWCALCEAYISVFHELEIGCVGCPVAARTGKAYCTRSPYGAASRAFNRWKYSEEIGLLSTKPRDAWRTAADAEIAFLESLREPQS